MVFALAGDSTITTFIRLPSTGAPDGASPRIDSGRGYGDAEAACQIGARLWNPPQRENEGRRSDCGRNVRHDEIVAFEEERSAQRPGLRVGETVAEIQQREVLRPLNSCYQYHKSCFRPDPVRKY